MTMYIQTVRDNGILREELERVQQLLRLSNHEPEKHHRLTQLFRALLTEKARQEVVQEVGQNNTRNAEDSGARPADNATGRVSTWNILQKQIARSGQ